MSIHSKKKNNFFSISLKTKWQRSNKKIYPIDIALFFRQLATLISSGIPIVESCEILRSCQDKKQFRIMIHTLKNEIETGKNLVSGLRQFPLYFDELVCHLVHAGEQTGTLDIMLQRIALYKEKSILLKKQITQALLYPMIIFFVASCVCIIMLTFIVPQFEILFSHVHTSLPPLTKWILKLSHFLRENIYLGVIPLMGSLLFRYYFKNSMTFRQHIDHAIMKLPIINVIINKIIFTRFIRNLAIVFSAGVPITEALRIVAKTCGNYNYTKAIIALQTHIISGQQLHATMQMNILFPPIAVQMIKVGEESGTLDNMLVKIAELNENEIDHMITHLAHLLEPLIMIVLGVLIGGFIIAMYLPIFKLGTII